MQDGRRNQTTKQAGEFLVAAELCRQGLIATTFSGNVPVYDIIASDEQGNHVLVQVKTINGSSSSWQFDVRQFVAVTLVGAKQVLGDLVPPAALDPVCVFVCLGATGQDRFFVFHWSELQAVAVAGYRCWLEDHGGGRPRKPDSFHCAVRPDDLREFENRWAILKGALRPDV